MMLQIWGIKRGFVGLPSSLGTLGHCEGKQGAGDLIPPNLVENLSWHAETNVSCSEEHPQKSWARKVARKCLFQLTHPALQEVWGPLRQSNTP